MSSLRRRPVNCSSLRLGTGKFKRPRAGVKGLPSLRTGVQISRTHVKARQTNQLPEILTRASTHPPHTKRINKPTAPREQGSMASDVGSFHAAQGDRRGITTIAYSLPSRRGLSVGSELLGTAGSESKQILQGPGGERPQSPAQVGEILRYKPRSGRLKRATYAPGPRAHPHHTDTMARITRTECLHHGGPEHK